MITASDKTLIEHELQNETRPWVLVKPRGWQVGFGGHPGRMLYNVVGGDWTTGTTCTAETLIAAGRRVEVIC